MSLPPEVRDGVLQRQLCDDELPRESRPAQVAGVDEIGPNLFKHQLQLDPGVCRRERGTVTTLGGVPRESAGGGREGGRNVEGRMYQLVQCIRKCHVCTKMCSYTQQIYCTRVSSCMSMRPYTCIYVLQT